MAALARNVGLEHVLDVVGGTIMGVADNQWIENFGGGSQRINGRIQSLRRQRTLFRKYCDVPSRDTWRLMHNSL